MSAQPPEPVTYTVRGLQCGTCGAWSDHRVSPDPRIAQLEGLLREALSCIHYARRAQGLDKPEIEQRIAAALKEG